MGSEGNHFGKRYRLRQAAGMYWLINVEQPGIPYEKPIALNEAGAAIFRMLEKDAPIEEIAEALSRTYDIPAKSARADVEQFVGQLKDCRLVP